MARRRRPIPYPEFARLSPATWPDWRWERATGLAAGADGPSRWADDAPTLAAVVFLRAVAGGAETPDPAVAEALAVFRADDPRRWRLEATILTGASTAAAAAAASLTPAVVAVYESLFFDVRPRLAARDWVAGHVVGFGPHLDGTPHGLGRFWRWAAYHGGGPALDLVVAVTAGGDVTGHPPAAVEAAELLVAVIQVPAAVPDRRVFQLMLRTMAGRTGGHPTAYHLPGSARARSGTAAGPLGKSTPPSHNASAPGPGWETRQRGGVYYYRPVRIGGQPRRIYLGTGAVGRVHELLDRRDRRDRAAAAAKRGDAARRAQECGRLGRRGWALARTLAHAGMVLSGWYSHRGEWRRVMAAPRSRQTKSRPATPAEATDLGARLAALAARANADPAGLADLRAFLDDHPEVWRQAGDLNRASADRWTDLLACGNALYKESVTRFVADWKGRLGGADPTPTETALVDAAAAARLAMAHAEAQATAPAASLAQAGFQVKQLDAATRRYAAALKLLAQVRAADPRGLTPVVTPAAGLPRLHVPPGRRKAG